MGVKPKPDWMRGRGVDTTVLERMKSLTDRYHLHTVCEGATCPNMGECFCAGTATFMILGDTCTRNCAFCSVPHGRPLPPDPAEPEHVALAARELGLRHVVITCVTRDDLPDGGARQFALTLAAIQRMLPGATTDVLISDLRGSRDNLGVVLDAGPDILAHNLETVPRLYARCRQQADYARSLSVLRSAKQLAPRIHTKSGLMLGLGETFDEVRAVMRDLRAVGCDFLTLGQYLRPAPGNLEVVEYIPPAQFDALRDEAERMGFRYVASAPFVRSSFHSEDALKQIRA